MLSFPLKVEIEMPSEIYTFRHWYISQGISISMKGF